jgi:hypothetical protein
MITRQFLAIYPYWGDLNVMSDIIGILEASVFLCFIFLYINIFWKNFSDVTDTFETNSIFCSELVRSNSKHMKIVNETLNRANIYNKIMSMFITVQILLSVLPTLVQNLMTSDEEILQAAETADGFRKYFPFVIWLPQVVKQKFVIRVMYGLQCIFWYEICLISASFCPFSAVLILFTGTQFKLISSIIREMEEVMYTVEKSDNDLHEVPEQIFTADSNNLSNESKLSSKMQQNSLQEDDINQHSERAHDLSSPEIKSTSKKDPGSVYLLECIKLHQGSIK